MSEEGRIIKDSIRRIEIAIEKRISLEELRYLSRVRISSDIDQYNRHQITRMSEMFMAGELIRKVDGKKEYTALTYRLPATKWDYLKEFITRCLPTLRFGWLVPKQKTYSREVLRKIEETYLNVYPAEEYTKIPLSFDNPYQYISPMEWLRGMPPTIEDLEHARERIATKSHKQDKTSEFLLRALLSKFKERYPHSDFY